MMKVIRWFFSCCSKIFVTSWVNSLTKFSEVTNQVLEIDWACLTINQLLISKKRAGTTASPICIFHWNPQMKECEKNPKPLSPVWFALSPSPLFLEPVSPAAWAPFHRRGLGWKFVRGTVKERPNANQTDCWKISYSFAPSSLYN